MFTIEKQMETTNLKVDEIKYWLFRLDKSEAWLAEKTHESKQRINYLLNKAKRFDNELIGNIEKVLKPLITDFDKSEYETLNKIIQIKKRNYFPIVSIVRAGLNNVIQEDIIGQAAFDYDKTEGCVAVRISGDSMQPELKEGDLALVDKNSFVDTGNIVVAIFHDGTHTIKRFRDRSEKEIELIPINTNYYARVVKKSELLAIYKVVTIQRNY